MGGKNFGQALEGGELPALCPAPSPRRKIGGIAGSVAELDAVEQRQISYARQEINPGRPARRTSLYGLSSCHAANKKMKTVQLRNWSRHRLGAAFAACQDAASTSSQRICT
jgi:hypothetical protein